MFDLPVGQGPVHITLLMGPKLARPVPAEVTEALLSAQITATAGERSGFQLAFDLTKNGVISRRLLPEGYFDPKTRLIVTVTVRGTPAVLFDGLVVRQEVGASNRPGNSTLMVTGEDLTLLMDLEERTARYPNLPPSERVLAILRRYSDYGIRPDVYTEKVAQPPHQDLRVHYQTGTDLQYVTELARANGYTFYLEPGPNPGQSSARWGPEVRLGIRQHALNVNLDAHSTVDQMTFAYDGTAREEPQARWQDPGTRQSTLLPQPPISPLRPPLGRRPTPALKRRTLSGTAFMASAIFSWLRPVETAGAISALPTFFEPQVGQSTKPRFFWRSKSSLLRNQASNSWSRSQIREKRIKMRLPGTPRARRLRRSPRKIRARS